MSRMRLNYTLLIFSHLLPRWLHHKAEWKLIYLLFRLSWNMKELFLNVSSGNVVATSSDV